MQEFVIEDGVLVKYNGNSETVIVPEGVKEIGEYSFKDNTAVRKVFLPDVDYGCVHVDFRAFEGCNLQFIRGSSIGFAFCALSHCTVRDVYGDYIAFDVRSFPKSCRIHSRKSERLWKECRECNVPWIADWRTIIAKEKDAEAAVQLPILTEELKKFRKANRKTVYMNKVLTNGTPYWFCALVFLAVTAAAYQICGNIEVLQQYYLRYLAPVAAGLVSLLLLKIIRLIWKAIRFHNKSGHAYQSYEMVTTLEKKIHEHRCNVLTPPALTRLKEEEDRLQAEFKYSGFYDIGGSMSVEDLNAALRHSYGLDSSPTSTDPNKDANSKGLATGLAN